MAIPTVANQKEARLSGSRSQVTHKIVLKIHLYLGLVAALFLIILGFTGSVIAFEGDIDHWQHAGFWYVPDSGKSLPEGELIAGVERQFAPAKVRAIQISQHRDLAQMMQMSDRSTVTVNPYSGAILSHRTGATRTQKWLAAIHQIHLRLAGDGRAAWAPAGKIAVSYAGFALFLLAPTGLVLWWRNQEAFQ
jgi:uncharacterized iron-regulated membrane protein